MDDLISRLGNDWVILLQTWGVDPAGAAIVFHDLVQRYTAANRHYHNLHHIAFVLQIIEELRPLAQDINTIQLAAWFHDAVYEPGAADNEEQSATLATQLLTGLGLPAAAIERVAQLILTTRDHRPLAGDIDSQILLDADLATLAAEPARYDAEVAGVRREYAHVPDEAFRRGRAQILSRFLERPRLFQTEAMYSRLEARARANIQREIE